MVVLTDINEIADFTAKRKLHLALGIFDGVHTGHQALLDKVIALSQDKGGSAGVLLLEPHPQYVFGNCGYQILTPVEEKIRLIQSYGDIHIIVQAFTIDFATLSGEDFVRDYLLSRYRISTAVCGYNYHFGNKGACSVKELQDMALRYGFASSVLPQVTANGNTVSSSEVRRLIRLGLMYEAYIRLGHCHVYSGQVVRGKNLGEKIGFPTANLEINPQMALPAYGVYGGFILDDAGAIHRGIINIGVRPTIDDGTVLPSFEAHIPGYQGDMYGRRLVVALTDRIRPESRFGSIADLQEQINCDIRTAGDALGVWERFLQEKGLSAHALFTCFIKDYPI